MSTFVDFSVVLPELPMVDLEGRCEVTVKKDGDEWAVTIEAVEVAVKSINRPPYYYYAPFPNSPLGWTLEEEIRAKLESDRKWLDSAAQQARSVA